MELAGGSDHHAGRGQKKRQEQAKRKIKRGQASVCPAPALAQHRVRQQEGHIDAHSGGGGSDHSIALRTEDDIVPVARVARFLDNFRELGRRLGEQAEIWNEAGENRPPIEAAGHRHDDAEETHHHDGHHDFQNNLEDLHPFTAAVVRPHHRRTDDKEQQHAPVLAVVALENAEVLLNGGRAERELRHGPHEVGQHRGDEPAPAEHRVDVFVDRAKRFLAGGERDVADDREHQHAENHHQRLEPEQLVATNHPDVKAASERTTTEGDRTLQPAGAGQLGESAPAGKERFLAGLREEGFFGGERVVRIAHGSG